jgi:O-antigen/teichoic acid export membrane protein
MSYFSPEHYGIISYINALITIFPVIATLGLSTYVIRFYFEQRNEVDKKKLIGNVFLFISFVNIIILVFGYVFIPYLLDFFKVSIPWNPYLKYAFIGYFLDIFSIIPLVLFRIKQNAKVFVFLNITKVVLQYVLILTCVIYYDLGLEGLYLGNLIALVPFFFIYVFLMFKLSILNINFQQIKEGLIFSLPLIPSSISFILLNYSDRFFIEKYVSLDYLGIYNIAFTIAFSLNLFISSIYKAVEPELFQKYSQGKEFKSFVNTFKKYYLFFLYVFAILIALFTQEIIFMISDEYELVYYYVPLILISVLMSGSNIIYSGILTAEKNIKLISKTVIIGTIISILLNAILIPMYGIVGACFSSAISFFTINLILYLSIENKCVDYRVDIYLLFTYIVFISCIFYLVTFSFSLTFSLVKILAFLLFVLFLLKISNIKFYKIILLVSKFIITTNGSKNKINGGS